MIEPPTKIFILSYKYIFALSIILKILCPRLKVYSKINKSNRITVVARINFTSEFPFFLGAGKAKINEIIFQE